MQKKTSFSYPTLQRIKSEEYERFFEGSQYYPYLNHLGELKWMTEEQADQQHEFFLYEESFVLRIKRKFGARRYPSWEKLPDKEKEIRLQIRKYLEETYRGELSPQTTRMLPNQWEAELTREEIESIPISLEIYESIGPNKSLVTAIFVLIICAGALLYFGPFNNSARSGALLVKTNVESARVYLNDKLFGYSGDEIANVPLGTHRVSLAKSGFVPIPKEKEIQIKNDTLIILNFRMDPVRSSDHGYLTVSADYSDSKIFIDNEYYGVIEDEPYLPLREGQHTVVIEKPGYVSVPERQGVTIAAGDTTFLQFEQRRAYSAPTSNQNNRGSNLRGTLEVNTNISGARIFINGKDSGKETEYVFTDIPMGRYSIELEMDGYHSIPAKHSVQLTSSDRTGEVSFELVKEFEQVMISTKPTKGEIFIDGESRGTGRFEGRLKIGKHTVSFGKIAGYNSPQSRIIHLEANSPIAMEVDYFPNIELIAEVSDNGNINLDNCDVATGYTFERRGFSASEEAGPEVVYHESLNSYFWKLGFAFPYRNPKGNDALKLSFSLPQELHYEQKFTLMLHAAASHENYPLALSINIDIKIKFNGAILSYYYEPKFWEDIKGMEEREWDISRHVKPGLNTLEIATTEENNAFYFVKRIKIHN